MNYFIPILAALGLAAIIRSFIKKLRLTPVPKTISWWKSALIVLVISMAAGSIHFLIVPPTPNELRMVSEDLRIIRPLIVRTFMFLIIWVAVFFVTWVIFKIARSEHSMSAKALLSLQTAALVFAIFVLGSWHGQNAAEGPVEREHKKPLNVVSSGTTISGKVIAVDTIQDAEGTKPEDLDVNFLNNLEAWLAEGMKEVMKAVAKEHLRQNRGTSEDFDLTISSSSVYIDVEGKHLGVVKLSAEGVRQVFVVGHVGEEFHRVSCLRMGDKSIALFSGVCGRKIGEVFGVKLQP